MKRRRRKSSDSVSCERRSVEVLRRDNLQIIQLGARGMYDDFMPIDNGDAMKIAMKPPGATPAKSVFRHRCRSRSAHRPPPASNPAGTTTSIQPESSTLLVGWAIGSGLHD